MRTTFIILAVACMLAVPAVVQAQCTVCDVCFDDWDCGLDEFCADFTDGSWCTAYCDFGPCPGDSQCYEVGTESGGLVYICLNPGAEVSFCDASYSCGGGGGDPDPVDLCAGVVCSGGGLCSPATGTCIGGNEDTSPPPDTSSPPDTSPADTSTPDSAVVLDTGVTPPTSPADTQSKQDTMVADDGRIAATGEGCACSLRNRERRVPWHVILSVFGLGVALVVRRRRH